ncbi:MAG: type VI secretion system tube protein TssD [Candidatus Hodarchaeota archaeon]
MSSNCIRKYFPIAVVLIGIISSVALALWTGSYFASADTAETAQVTEDASTRIFMILEGEQQGLIKGDVIDPDKAGYIECSSYRHSLITPREESTGMLIGKRQHKPVKITKSLDSATPLILKALITNEVINATILFIRTADSGDEHYFTVILENGYVAGVSQLSEDAEMGGESTSPSKLPIEEITFVYSKIIWTYILNGNSSDDSWDDNS